MNRDYGCAECDLANDGRHTYECLRDQDEDRRTRNAVRNTRLLTLTEAIERLERKRMRNAVLELRTMMRDDAAAKKPRNGVGTSERRFPHGEKPADRARDLLRGRLGNELWDAINRYAVECGGDPSTNIYGATRRQAAVAEIVRVVEAVAVATAGGKR